MGRMLRKSNFGVFAAVCVGSFLGVELVEFVPLVPDLTSEVVVGALVGGRYLTKDE